MSCLHRSPYLRVWSCLRWFNTHLSFVFGMLYLSSRQMNSTILTCCRIIRMHLIVLWVVLQGTLNLKTCQKLMWPIFVMNWAWDFLEIRDSVWCKVDGGQKYSIQLNLYAFYCIIISVFFFFLSYKCRIGTHKMHHRLQLNCVALSRYYQGHFSFTKPRIWEIAKLWNPLIL
jgi:hypothetical protein